MSNYKIGIYNPKIEKSDELNECNIIFDNFESLKAHVRVNDEILYISGFSFYGAKADDIIEIISKYNLKFHSVENKDNTNNSDLLTIHTLIAINDYIKANKELISQLLK